jgi:hypothetical protein
MNEIVHICIVPPSELQTIDPENIATYCDLINETTLIEDATPYGDLRYAVDEGRVMVVIPANLSKYDRFEISAVYDDGEQCTRISADEIENGSSVSFWTIYGYSNSPSEAIIDFQDKDKAMRIFNQLQHL